MLHNLGRLGVRLEQSIIISERHHEAVFVIAWTFLAGISQ
jgi:hypothetical protein